MSSLFKRVMLPLLAVAAACTLTASLCASTQAATASLQCRSYGSSSIYESLDCTMTGNSVWNSATFFASNNIYATSNTQDTFTDYGPGDYYRSSSVPVPGTGTYDCRCECDGLQDNNNPWQAFTSTISVTV